MPKIPQQQALYLEHGTIKEVVLMLQEQGEDVTYHQIAKRIRRKTHVETLRLALEVSAQLRQKREREQAEIQELINQSKQEARP